MYIMLEILKSITSSVDSLNYYNTSGVVRRSEFYRSIFYTLFSTVVIVLGIYMSIKFLNSDVEITDTVKNICSAILIITVLLIMLYPKMASQQIFYTLPLLVMVWFILNEEDDSISMRVLATTSLVFLSVNLLSTVVFTYKKYLDKRSYNIFSPRTVNPVYNPVNTLTTTFDNLFDSKVSNNKINDRSITTW